MTGTSFKSTAFKSTARATGVLLAALLLVVGGCGGTRPCRSGTLFLSLKFGALSRADLLTIDVMVNAGPKKTLSQTLAHASAGSVELTFPSGYVAGSTVTLQATLSQGVSVLAVRGPVSVTLAPGCSSLELDFSGADAGGLGGSPAGSGGTTAGSGGATGAAGAGGVAVSSGGVAGASSGGAAGTASSGGAAGSVSSGGAAGTTASGGAGGTTASGGAGGTTGSGGGTPSGGKGGTTAASGGNGGAGGGAGGSPCRPTSQTENCYNDVDDNCDGKIDCEDPGCTSIATCVALEPGSGSVGQSIDATAACPPEAPNAKTLQNGVTASGCAGCSCAAGTATLVCSADLYGYGTLETGCGNNTGGTLAGTVSSAQSCASPWPNQSVTGIRASAFRGVPAGSCQPTGTPTKGSPMWSTSTKFCGVPNVGGGCRAGSSCVPRPIATAGACVLLAGTQSCPTAAPKASAWFTGVTDGRTCGACQCGAPTGGDCASMLLRADGASSCDANTVLGYIRSGDKLCGLSLTGVSSPGISFSGSAQPVSCAASSAMSGALTTTGPQTLCCP